jgi:hypothetical protein
MISLILQVSNEERKKKNKFLTLIPAKLQLVRVCGYSKVVAVVVVAVVDVDMSK